MSGPFRENIKQLVEKLDGGVAAFLMGFDGITVDSFATAGHDDALPDIQTLAMEFAHLIAQARRTLQSLDAGALEEFTLRTDSKSMPPVGVGPTSLRVAPGAAFVLPSFFLVAMKGRVLFTDPRAAPAR